MQIKLFGWRLSLTKDRPAKFGEWKPGIGAVAGQPIDAMRASFAAAIDAYYNRGKDRG